MSGIYVHIPYCSSRCIYCDFYSSRRDDFDGYAAALSREALCRKEFLGGVPPQTLYFGGGTPSILPERVFSGIVSLLRDTYDLSHLVEFTIEVNPDDVSPTKASFWRSLGVNRISMGVQSFCDSHLRWMNRRHTAAGAIAAFDFLRRAGMHNISIDLIFGFNGLSDRDWDYSLERAVELHPEHISCYQMMGRHASENEDVCAGQYSRLQHTLTLNGYRQYEVSNFSLPGFESIHNQSYWKRLPYLGLGASAHSFNGHDARCWNIPDISRYINSYMQSDRFIFPLSSSCNDDAFAYSNVSACANADVNVSGHILKDVAQCAADCSPLRGEILSRVEIFEEELMLGLRRTSGININSLDSHFLAMRKPSLDELASSGDIVVENDGTIRIPCDRMFVSDWIIGKLFA